MTAAQVMEAGTSGVRWSPPVGAVLAGAAMLGCIASAGQMLFRAKPWWAVLMESTLPLVIQALFLLVTVDWALRARSSRWPRWAMLAAAAVASTAAAALFDWAASYTLRMAMDMTYGFGSDYISRWWAESPTLLVVGGLGAFGAASASDAMRRLAALQDLQIERARLARVGMEAELAAMQARVNPRFLFETLSDIESTCERDPGAGVSLLDELTVYLRTALAATRDSTSTLAVELDLARAWLRIASARTAGRITHVIATGDAPLDARVPPMLLLPLVEHADGCGTDTRRAILVSAEVRAGRLRIAVIGPSSVFAGAPVPAAEPVRGRLASLYGGDANLELHALSLDRSEAVLDIPLERAPGIKT